MVGLDEQGAGGTTPDLPPGSRIGMDTAATLPALREQWRDMRIRCALWLAVVGPVLAACGEVAIDPEPTPSDPVGPADTVTDLSVIDSSLTTLTLEWTQVDDGTGSPASYGLKYAPPPIVWTTATTGCDPTMAGTSIGSSMSCEVEGLASGTTYELQLKSFRVVDDVWQGAVESNVARGST